MSFKWRCTLCNSEIIIPYNSVDNLSSYSIPYCKECFDEFIANNFIEKDEMYSLQTDDDEDCLAYSDSIGIIFKCKSE